MKAVYAGTFDPITNGHLDIIKRALGLFEEIVVAVVENPSKKTLFSAKERVELAKKSIPGLNGVRVEGFNGLLVEFCKKNNIFFIIRGLRALSDFEQEFQMASMNKSLNKKIETIFFITSQKYFYLSSSIVKEIAKHKGRVKEFVTVEVEKALKEKFF